jgi:CubicO group peptidase (beta-lactamase class C family)
MLLALILEKVTGGSVSKYLEDKIWIPCGMEAPAYWSLDRSDNMAIEKAFCCLQARTIDFAKIARLYLNNGNWQGKQIVSKDWVNYSTHSDPSGNNKHFFNNNWGIGPYKYNSYFAAGLYGQYLYVYPEKNIIIVRFGEKDLSYNPNYFAAFGPTVVLTQIDSIFGLLSCNLITIWRHFIIKTSYEKNCITICLICHLYYRPSSPGYHAYVVAN